MVLTQEHIYDAAHRHNHNARAKEATRRQEGGRHKIAHMTHFFTFKGEQICGEVSLGILGTKSDYNVENREAQGFPQNRKRSKTTTLKTSTDSRWSSYTYRITITTHTYGVLAKRPTALQDQLTGNELNTGRQNTVQVRH